MECRDDVLTSKEDGHPEDVGLAHEKGEDSEAVKTYSSFETLLEDLTRRGLDEADFGSGVLGVEEVAVCQ